MEHSSQQYSCPECHSGHMKTVGTFLFVERAGMPLCIPDFPAWVCDLCGLREYDRLALSELEVMLDTNRRSMAKKPGHRVVGDHDLGGRDAESGHRPKS
jgi:YgiT-type zinc finger domain-containing protein